MLQKILSMRETVLHSIFIDLRKAYDTLDRNRCLDILSGYGVRTRTLRVMWKYWVRIQMAEKEGGQYGYRLPDPPGNIRRFYAGRGTGNITLEAKMLQKILSMRETVLHSIFIDLRKAYDTLDRNRCLDILSGYGVRTRTLRVMWKYWVRIQMAEKEGGQYGYRLPDPPQGNSGGTLVTHDI